MESISRIILKNIRGFKTLELNLNRGTKSKKSNTIILGKNGTCKTTLLRAIAIGISDSTDGNAMLAEPLGKFISNDFHTGKIILEISSRKKIIKQIRIETVIGLNNGKEYIKDKTGFNELPDQLCVCGYGAGRSTITSEDAREYRTLDSTYSLFNYEVGLNFPELILRRLRDYLGSNKYFTVMQGLKRAIRLTPRDNIETPKGGGIELSGPSFGAKIPFEAWADGYRLTFTWILDLYAWAMMSDSVTKSGDINGIVLIRKQGMSRRVYQFGRAVFRKSFNFPTP